MANVVSLINQPTGNDDAAVGPLLRKAALHDDGVCRLELALCGWIAKKNLPISASAIIAENIYS